MLEGELDPDKFFPWVQNLVATDGQKILRSKGILAFKDDPIFAADKVEFVGQVLFAVAADSIAQARAAAKLAVVEYEDLAPVLTVEEALVQTADIIATNGVVHTVDRVLMPPKR